MPLGWDMNTSRAASVAVTTERGAKVRVKMLEERMAAPDGGSVVRLEKGETYDLPEALALTYIERGRAEEFEPEGEQPEGEQPSTTPPPRPRRKRA